MRIESGPCFLPANGNEFGFGEIIARRRDEASAPAPKKHGLMSPPVARKIDSAVEIGAAENRSGSPPRRSDFLDLAAQALG